MSPAFKQLQDAFVPLGKSKEPTLSGSVRLFEEHPVIFTSKPPITNRPVMLNLRMVSATFSMCLFGRVLAQDVEKKIALWKLLPLLSSTRPL